MMDNIKKNMTGAFDSMKKLFPVSKTIAFRLLPVGKTLENIGRMHVTQDASQLAADYKLMKGAADRIHKRFIEETLSGLHIKYLSDGGKDSIQEYAEVYFRSDEPEEEADKEMTKEAKKARKKQKAKEKEAELEAIALNLKKQIGQAFSAAKHHSGGNMLKKLASKELLRELVAEEELSEEEAAALVRMQPYTTYMTDYMKRRAALYDSKAKGHTVPNRIVDDNLPIHLANAEAFDKLPAEILEGAAPLFNELSGAMQAFDLRDVFTPSYFSILSAQSAIDIYNTLIGGFSREDGVKVKGLNELVNEYNQTHEKKVHAFDKLKKQILSDRDTLSWLPDIMTCDREVVEAIDELHAGAEKFKAAAVRPDDPAKVYVDAKCLSVYSKAAFGDYGKAERCIMRGLEEKLPQRPREKDNKYEERIKKAFKTFKHFSVADIHAAVERYETPEDGQTAADSLKAYCAGRIVKPMEEAIAAYGAFHGLVEGKDPDTFNLKDTAADGGAAPVEYAKQFLDLLTDARRAASVFTDPGSSLETDTDFYAGVADYFKEFGDMLTPTYNTIRNYLTKKPFSQDKVQVYFSKPSLLSGWDVNKEPTSLSVILRKGEKIYLGIISKNNTGLFNADGVSDESSPLKKMYMKSIPEPHKMLPHVAFCSSRLRSGTIPHDILALYERKKKQPDTEYTREEVTMMVNYYKDIIANNHDWDVFGLKLRDASEYERMMDFFDDVARQAYKIRYAGVSEAFVETAVENGELFLFEITCQDMLEKHHGKDGHYKVLLYRALEDLRGADIRLNGGAAVYFRKASLKRVVTHPAGVPMVNKNPDSRFETRTLTYDLIKDRRYTEDRYMFHVPVCMNPRADDHGNTHVNSRVNELIKENPGMYVLGINRGERNLISIALTAPDGTIVEQRNLNVFDNFNYQRKLDEREKERTEDRRNWTSVRDIKLLKSGYLSRAVGEVASLVKKYHCIVALERLDDEFKTGRQQFEKNVYEQFERDLIGKLSFFMDKQDGDRLAGALQLTDPKKTEVERTKYPQNGIVLLVNPTWCSKTDPLTGFVNRLAPYYTTLKDAEEFIGRADAFRYDTRTGRFVLSFRYGTMVPGKVCGDPERVWKVETYGQRIETVREKENSKKWTTRTVDLTAEMKALFDGNGIEYADGENLAERMCEKGAAFWKEFFRLLRLTLQLSNWDPATREYRIIGCTANAAGLFFDSRIAPERYPKDGDTLAAWNIARKAHIVMRRIREFVPGETVDAEGKKVKAPGLTVSNAEWLDAVQG